MSAVDGATAAAEPECKDCGDIFEVECRECDGAGYIEHVIGPNSSYYECESCGGTGWVWCHCAED